jgi:hypothetical protein
MANMISDSLTATQAAFSMSVQQTNKILPISLGTFLFSFISDMLPQDDSMTSRIVKSIVSSFKTLFVVNLAK